jgi:hypothetical protein
MAGSYCHGSLPALKGAIAYRAQSVEKKLVPWTVPLADFASFQSELREEALKWAALTDFPRNEGL